MRAAGRLILSFSATLLATLSAACGKSGDVSSSSSPVEIATTASLKSYDCALSSTWQTAYQYQRAAGKPASASSIALDSTGAIYVVGSADNTSNVSHWIVMKSADQGATWTKVDDFRCLGSFDSYAISVVIDSTDGIYVGGGSIGRWIVRKSTSGGSSWTTVDDDNSYPIGSYIKDGAAGADGSVYFVGEAYTSAEIEWVVRKSGNGGSTWATVDSYSEGGTIQMASDVAVAPDGAVYVAGHAAEATGGEKYLIRKSVDGGATWSVVHRYSDPDIFFDGYLAIDPLGTIYAGWQSYRSGLASRWYVEKWSSGRTLWTPVDDFQYAASKNSYINGMLADASGEVFAYGTAYDSGTTGHWLVRRSARDGVDWTTIDDYQLVTGKNAAANRVARADSGHLYAVGKAADSAGVDHFIVRTLKCE